VIDKIFEKTSEKATKASPLGGTIKFAIDEYIIHIDGTGNENIVTKNDLPADTTITVSEAHFIELTKGELNPMMAVMTGKVKISGDMGLALKIQSLI
jgi:putative sterol carrier protein